MKMVIWARQLTVHKRINIDFDINNFLNIEGTT